ncbi:unnamed protein product [Symbiodinium natans]|uniref:Uncharacterized protein n=1 Tax=Symbiodinium natans TaxID=878477 RepID=A0A812TSS0_9DINO|nr:unnamed protein product [Symbiodinium natans]
MDQQTKARLLAKKILQQDDDKATLQHRIDRIEKLLQPNDQFSSYIEKRWLQMDASAFEAEVKKSLDDLEKKGLTVVVDASGDNASGMATFEKDHELALKGSPSNQMVGSILGIKSWADGAGTRLYEDCFRQLLALKVTKVRVMNASIVYNEAGGEDNVQTLNMRGRNLRAMRRGAEASGFLDIRTTEEWRKANSAFKDGKIDVEQPQCQALLFQIPET